MLKCSVDLRGTAELVSCGFINTSVHLSHYRLQVIGSIVIIQIMISAALSILVSVGLPVNLIRFG